MLPPCGAEKAAAYWQEDRRNTEPASGGSHGTRCHCSTSSQAGNLPRLRRPHRAVLGLLALPDLRLGQVRVSSAGPGYALLDQRQRGTKFVSLPIKSVLNSPLSTGMDFWSVNPYVGCEFGCTYCYARFAHQYVVERSAAKGVPVEGAWTEEDFSAASS